MWTHDVGSGLVANEKPNGVGNEGGARQERAEGAGESCSAPDASAVEVCPGVQGGWSCEGGSLKR